MPVITLRLLGPVDVAVDGEAPPAELLWRKNVALLAYLAMAPDRRAGREQLTGLLWGEKPEKAARHSLAEALRIIRSCTGDGVEEPATGYIRLADGAVETDTAQFAARLAADDPAGASALVRGEFMQGFALPAAWTFEEWLAGERRTWRSKSEAALVAAANAALAGGAPEEAHGLADRALALGPTSDTACQVAMRSLCLRGDRGEALQLFDAFKRMLDEELAILPSDDTAALADRIRQQRTWRLPAGRAARHLRGAESRRAPLVGRGPALGALVQAWEACRDGAGARTAVITGDAGTGRTRLLQELLKRVRLDGGVTAEVRAVPADVNCEGTVLTALGRTAGFDPTARGLHLADALAPGEPGAPLVVAIDDADWCDEPSLVELTAVTSKAAGARLMMVFAAGRQPPAPVEKLSANLGRDAPGALVTLDTVGPEALRELAAWAMPGYDDDALERLTRRLVAETAGYPLLAVELLHAIAHGLAAEPARETWPAAGRTLDQTRPGDLPDTLVASVRVGFRVLTPGAQHALAAAAVLDPPVSAERIAVATGLEGRQLEEALDELEWQRWLTADARGYGFVARLVRDIVAQDMVTAGQRRRILEGA
ncbi:MAG: BTAD domain-containing putative transcriptional regulator [Gemmatimonadota bacterium]|jgi:DNA-binding SARP family transcriptional activator